MKLEQNIDNDRIDRTADWTFDAIKLFRNSKLLKNLKNKILHSNALACRNFASKLGKKLLVSTSAILFVLLEFCRTDFFIDSWEKWIDFHNGKFKSWGGV